MTSIGEMSPAMMQILQHVVWRCMHARIYMVSHGCVCTDMSTHTFCLRPTRLPSLPVRGPGCRDGGCVCKTAGADMRSKTHAPRTHTHRERERERERERKRERSPKGEEVEEEGRGCCLAREATGLRDKAATGTAVGKHAPFSTLAKGL